MTQAQAGEHPASVSPDQPGREDEVISPRLVSWLDEVLAARAPNTGRFCGNCYHPLAAERSDCPHCGTSTRDVSAVASVPLEIIEAHRRRRGREGTVVRTVAWGGLTLGVTLSLVPLAFAGVKWWSAASFFAIMFGFYILSANLANSLGDSLGYRWGLAGFRKTWDRHVAERDAAATR
jgi:hypothetical protein